MGAPSITERIREAILADAQGCARVYAPAVLTGTGTFETVPPDAAEMERRIANVLQRGWPWLVAEGAGGRILGYAYCTQFRDRAAYARTAETSVYVAPDVQGGGLGSRLMTALLEASKTSGFQTFVAVIGDSSNAASIALHQAAGFRQVGVLKGVGLKFGRQIDVVLMQLD